MAWQTLERNTTSRNPHPVIVLEGTRRIRLNAAAARLLGSPPAVDVLWDEETQRFGLRVSTAALAFPVKYQPSGAATIYCSSVFNALRITDGKSHPFGAALEDDVLVGTGV
jgi:hypothetical protein